MKINTKVFCKLLVSFYILEYFQKKGSDEVNFFCLQININLSFKLIPLILVGMTRPAQITQNKSAKSFQYLKKEVRDEVDFLCR